MIAVDSILSRLPARILILRSMARLLRTSVGTVALAVGSSCSDVLTAPRPSFANEAISADRLRASLLSRGRTERTGIEADILRIEEVVPGFAGFYLDTITNEFVMRLRAHANRGRATAELKLLLGTLQMDSDVRARALSTSEFRAESADYDFAALVGWHTALRASVFKIRGVIGLDANEQYNRIRVSVAEGTPSAAVLSVAARLGVPSEAIEIVMGVPQISGANLRDRWRAYGGGVQISTPSQTCSIGFAVSSPSGERGFLTASHCASLVFGAGDEGVPVYQANVNVLDQVGTITNNPPWDATMCGYALCAVADVLYVTASNANDAQKRVASTTYRGENNQGGSIAVNGWWWNQPYVTSPYMGQPVDKQGRTTGWTRGTVGLSCDDVVVDAGTSNEHMVLCATQVTGSRFGQGDSGGPVFYFTGTYLYPMGIAFSAGPMLAQDPSGLYYCATNCTMYFSHLSQVNLHLGGNYNPIP